MKLSKLFTFSYGSKLDLNKMQIDNNGINFVGRTAKNLGVVSKVKKINKKELYSAGLITVALGGSVLSSFVQPEPFYTAQNIMVLTPIHNMTLQEKIFYCICIKKNDFRYRAYGREANRTLKDLEVPEQIPNWVNKMLVDESIANKPFSNQEIKLTDIKWSAFTYDDKLLFEIKKGQRIVNRHMREGNIPCIRPIDKNNGVFKYIDIEPNHRENTITVNYNGSVGEAFYQEKPFFALDDINILYPKFRINVYIAMFLITLIQLEKYRFSYGRKWHLERMNKSIIKLPVNEKGEPDWKFMEDYIKSLPYSNNL